MTTEKKLEYINDMEKLQERKALTSDFIEQMELADSIHQIEMKLNDIKPTDSSMDCFGCGS